MHRRVMGFTMAGLAILDDLVPSFMAVYALQLTVFTRVHLLAAVLLFMTAAAQLGRHVFSKSRRGRSMMLVTLEAVTGAHVTGMSVMTTQTVEFFPVAGMTFGAFLLGMGAWKALHFFTRFLVTTKTDATQVIYRAEVGYLGRMRIMTLCTAAGCKMFVFTRVMALPTCWYDPFFPGRMFRVTFRAGQVLKVRGTICGIRLYRVFMTGRT